MLKRLSLVFMFSLALSLGLALPALADDPIIGEVVMFAGDTSAIPDGWVVCDGSEYSQSSYSELYSVLGSWYGSATSGYFKVPDFDFRMPIGPGCNYDTGAAVCINRGWASGEAVHTLTVPEMPVHNHPPGSATRFVNFTLNGGSQSPFQGGTHQMSSATTTGSAGGGQPHNNLPPYLAVNFIIYTGVYANPATPTPTATPTNTPTATATPTGTVTIYLPQVDIDVYTHTLRSGTTYTVPMSASFGQIFAATAGLILATVFVTAFVFRLVYRQ